MIKLKVNSNTRLWVVLNQFDRDQLRKLSKELGIKSNFSNKNDLVSNLTIYFRNTKKSFSISI